MAESYNNGVENTDGNKRPEALQSELNGHAFELLNHILPNWIYESFKMQSSVDASEELRNLELSLYQKSNFRKNEIPRLRVRLEPHAKSEPIEYLNLGQLVDLTIIVPLPFIADLEEVDALEMAMLHVRLAKRNQVALRKLALIPTSLSEYSNFENLVIETVKDQQGKTWIDSVSTKSIINPDIDGVLREREQHAYARIALNGFRRIQEWRSNKTVKKQLEEVKLLRNLLDDDELLRVGSF